MNTIEVRSRAARISAAAAVAGLALAGCSGDEATGEQAKPSELVVAESVAPDTFDPIMSDVISTWYPWRLVYDTLLTSQADGSLEPELATEWEIADDGLTYTFELREGVTFHNGEPFTADDVVFTFTRLKEEGIPYTQARFASLQSVVAVDDDTVEFQLANRDGGFLSNLGDPFAVGSAVLNREAATSADPGLEVVGTGPYQVDEYLPDQELTLERFGDYWREGAANKTLRIVYLPEQSAQTAALRGGQIDLMFPTAESNRALAEADVEIVEIVSGTVEQLEINVTKNPALADERVRQAIALSIDRDAIVATALLGSGAPSAQLPSSLGYSVPLDDLPNSSRDVEEAKALLADAGYPDGLALSLDVYATASETLKRTTEVLEVQLEESGFDITINTLEFAAWLDKFNAGDFELISNVTSYKSDPYWYVKVRPNRHGEIPAELTAFEAQILGAADQEEYIALVQEYQQMQAATVLPNISLVAEGAWVASSPGWVVPEPPVSMDRSFLLRVVAS